MNVREPKPADITARHESETTISGCTVEKFLLCNEETGQQVPANLWLPEDVSSDATPVLLVHPSGKQALIAADGTPVEVLGSNLAEGKPVLSIDMFGTGEYPDVTDRDEGINNFATYNLTDAACRIQDILLSESYLAERFSKPPIIHGLDGAGAEVLLAHGLATRSAKTIADLSGLDFTDDQAFVERLNIPNIRLYGDLATSIIVGRERPVEWMGCGDPDLEERLLRGREGARSWRK